MSRSPIRHRLAALAAVVPVLVAVGPFTAPAYAVDSVRQAALTKTARDDYRIGPNAGFRGDVAHGVDGRTAIVAIDLAPSATLNSVSVSFDENGPFALANEFDQNGGFQLYKEIAPYNDRLDPAEYAAGPVSEPSYSIGSDANGSLITVTGTAAATGSGRYLFVAHPAASAADGRILDFSVPPNGVVASTGSMPAARVDIADIVMDSAAPAAIPSTNFEPVNRAPGLCTAEAPVACHDGYKVYLGGTPTEPQEKIGFFNSDSTADSALLTIAGQQVAPALYDVQTLPDASQNAKELSIGNGTGRDVAANTKALNNQTSDDVFVKIWDEMGNVTGYSLTNTPPPCQTPPCAFVARGNDVTAPALSYTATMNHVTSATNTAAVPVTATLGGPDTAVPAGVAQTPIWLLATPQSVQPVAGTTTYVLDKEGTQSKSASSVIPAAAATIVANVDMSNAEKFPQNAFVRAVTRLSDGLGNVTATNVETSPVRMKDTLPPSLLSASLIDANTNGAPDTGEEYRIAFNDPMDTTKITSANLASKLVLTSPSPCGGTNATFTVDEPLCVSWGDGATVAWSGGDKLLTITLGTVCSPNDEPIPGDCTNAARLPSSSSNDSFTVASDVTDPVGNTVQNPANFPLSPPAVLAYSADTGDLAATFGDAFQTGRDGVLDTVDVKFTGKLNSSSVAQAATDKLFSVSIGSTKPDVTGVQVISGANNDLVRITFSVKPTDVATWRTGARPEVTLVNKPETTATGVKDTANNAIGAFSFGTIDKVSPVPLSIKTQDANGDGHIDHAVVTYTEGIQQGTENPCGYAVAGYGSQTYGPANAEPTQPNGTTPKACPVPAQSTAYRNKPTAGATNDIVVLDLTTLPDFDTEAQPSVRFDYNNQLPPYKIKTSDPTKTQAPDCASSQAYTPPNTTNLNASCPVKDTAGNVLNTFAGIAADGAGAAPISRSTADLNGDGHLDRINVTFSEDLYTNSLSNAVFEITAPVYAITSVTGLGSDGITIKLQPGTGPVGDTGVTPTVTFKGGTLDLAENASPQDTAAVVAADKAGPAIMRACTSSPAGNNGSCPVESTSNDLVNVFFSEPAVTATTNAVDAFAVTQDGADKAVTAVTPAADNTYVTLTLAEGAIAATPDAFVRLKSAGAIKDTAATPNVSTQVGNVLVSPVPVVTLALACATPANTGYCGNTSVLTNIGGTGQVTGWRLSETPRAATPPESEWAATPPASYPSEGALTEGSHTLYLSGRDAFGRLSAEVSKSITILKTPKILNVQWVNATPAKPGTYSKSDTVLDGDVVKIGADAYGTDAASWAANNAPTGGGCLVQNLKVNVSQLLGDGSKTAVKPTSCDLRTNTEQPYRQLQWSGLTAAGTTKYPVGTVLRVSPSDPGSMIVDGPNGTQLRRQFISVAARRSWQITDASTILVANSTISRIARGSNLAYRDGSIVRTTTSGYYYVAGGIKRPVSTATLAYWKIPTSTAYVVTLTEMRAMPNLGEVTAGAHAVGMWIKFPNGSIQQVVRRSDGRIVRRALANPAALRTLVPTNHIYSAIYRDSQLPLDTYLRGYRDGTLLKTSQGFAVISRASVRKFANAQVFNTLGYATSNALPANGAAISHDNGQAYRTGETIDRYKITSIVITVTNSAGSSAQARVKPVIDGIYGVGTLDPAPAGWDFTRSWS